MPFIDLQDIPENEPVPGYHVRFVHSDTMTMAYWTIEAGAEIPEHAHPHEQVATVTEGEFELVVDDEARRMGAGDVAVIPSDVPHSGRAITDCRMIDAFHPVREDYREE